MFRVIRAMNVSYWNVCRRHVSMFTTFCNLISLCADVMCVYMYLFWAVVKTSCSYINKQYLHAGLCNEGAVFS
jgi:hypothetical protein